jgi:hypothetical protein
VKRLAALALVLFGLPCLGLASTVYNYSGAKMTCAGTCAAGTYSITISLEFNTPLIANTKYVNTDYVVTNGPVSGAINADSLLTGWSISNRHQSLSSSGLFTDFLLYLDTDASGAIQFWQVGASLGPTSDGFLLLGSQNPISWFVDFSVYTTPLPGGTTNTDTWATFSPSRWGATPEPSTLALSAFALGALAAWRRRSR